MKLKEGSRVIYPHHGAAIVKKKVRKRAFGRIQEYLMLEIVHGDMMQVAMPADKAEEVGIRPPVSRSEVDDLMDLISKTSVREPKNWSRRFKNYQEKLRSSDIYQVAEVVRNLHLRSLIKDLSAGEKKLYEKAESLLVSEISFSLNTSEEKALDKIKKFLK